MKNNGMNQKINKTETEVGRQKKSAGNPPNYKGEIYFSNPPRNLAEKTEKPSAKKKGKHFSTNLIIFLSIVLLATSFLTYIAISCINDVLAINREEGEGNIVTVSIPEDATTKDIIKILDQNGLIKQQAFCNIFMRFVNKMKGTEDPKYLNGVYYVNANDGIESMLNQFKSAQSAAKTVKLVFPEGWSLFQMIKKLEDNKVCKSEYLFAALNETGFNYSFVGAIDTSSNRTQKFEGYCFPDTYEFFVEENANSVINRLLANFESRWSDTYTKKAQAMGMSTDEIISIASIIQKEAANAEEMALISSILHNRLAKPSVYPALECDATKDYIIRVVKPVLGEAKANSYFDAYNTYLSPGLPPGPICNPGINAIEAALNPKETNYYYFQHDKFGKIYLGKTLDEHNSNTMEVLRVNNK